MLAGPMIGAALYSFGGYQLPFFTFATLNVLMIPLVGYLLIQADIPKTE